MPENKRQFEWGFSFSPFAFLRLPLASDFPFLVGNHHVHKTIVVQIHNPHSVVPAAFVAQWIPLQQILLQPLRALFEIQKLHLLAVRLLRVVDEGDELLGAAPAVGVEDEVHHALFAHGDVEGAFPILEQLRILAADEILCLPIAGHGAGEFPAQAVDHIRIRIILNRAHVRTHRAHPLAMFGRGFARKILGEALGTVLVQHPLARERFVLGGGYIKHRRIDFQKSAVRAGLVKNLRKEARAQTVHRIATWHPISNRFVPLNLAEQIHPAVNDIRRLLKIPLLQKRTRMRKRVDLDGHSLGEPRLHLLVIRRNAARHNTHRRAPIDFF